MLKESTEYFEGVKSVFEYNQQKKYVEHKKHGEKGMKKVQVFNMTTLSQIY